jgi:UDP-GlcNAc3NAcA epimerase
MPIKIYKSGDVMQDAAIYYAQKAEEKSRIIEDLRLDKFILATIHRQENTDNPDNLAGIVQGLNLINKITPVIVPIHPRTKKILSQQSTQPEFTMTDPIGYFDMIMLLKNCEMVFTDSGGV